MAQQRKLAVRLLLRLLAHAARIEHDEIRLVHALYFFPTQRVEDAGDALRVRHVHLAADGPDVIFALGDAHLAPPCLAARLDLALRPGGWPPRLFAAGRGARPFFSTCESPSGSFSTTSPSSMISSSVTRRTSSGPMRSTKRMPSRWSISCCRMRANQPSALIRISLPLGSRAF